MAKRKMIEIDGKVKSIGAWARFYGKDPSTVYERVKRGWDVIEAITFPKSFTGMTITAGGQTRTIKSWAKANDLSADMIYHRLQAGWAESEAVGVRRYSKVGVTAFGKTLSYRQWSVETGIPRATIQRRISTGQSPEAALTLPVGAGGTKRQGLTAFGKTQSYPKWAAETGIRPDTLRKRVATGLSPEVALRLPVAPGGRKPKRR